MDLTHDSGVDGLESPTRPTLRSSTGGETVGEQSNSSPVSDGSDGSSTTAALAELTESLFNSPVDL